MATRDSKPCPRCGLLNPPDAQRCDCGHSFVTGEGVCHACGIRAATRYVEFRQNIGALVVRYHKSVKGTLCKSCINRYFLEFTGVTLVLGWWGLISLVVAPVYVVSNVVRYLGARGLEPPPRAARTTAPPVAAASGGASSPRQVVTVACWRCKRALKVAPDMRGREVACPSCGTRQALPT